MFSLKFILTIVGMLFSPKFANAFIAKAFGASRVNALFVSTESVPSGERINKIVDLESPKVVSMVELKAGEKCVVCRCWQRFVNSDLLQNLVCFIFAYGVEAFLVFVFKLIRESVYLLFVCVV